MFFFPINGIIVSKALKEKEGETMRKAFVLKGEYLTLGQFLKEINEISSGGMAKWYLQENEVQVDGAPENRRGRKLYQGMQIELPDGTEFQIVTPEEDTKELVE